ncbi:MAG TPA: hypothetical protein VLH12_08555 [Usitatibacter sp.]|nr:hypothetical protein [Usitatibacter sp.]
MNEEFQGAFTLADWQLRERVNELVGHFHIRDGAKNPDGSRGTIRISPDQLRDVLTFAFLFHNES